jgi:hypothetical protein
MMLFVKDFIPVLRVELRIWENQTVNIAVGVSLLITKCMRRMKMQLHINIDTDDEIIEQAALNAIKTKVREIVSQEESKLIRVIVEEEVKKHVEAIQASSWKRDELTKKAIQAVNEAGARKIAEDQITNTVERYLKNVADASNKAIDEIQKVDIVKIVENLTSNLVKMLFGQSLSKILSEVITQKTENKDE